METWAKFLDPKKKLKYLKKSKISLILYLIVCLGLKQIMKDLYYNITIIKSHSILDLQKEFIINEI